MTEEEIRIKIASLTEEAASVVMRAMAKRRVTDAGCWLFTGMKSDGGYGILKYKGRRVSAHRIMLRFLKPEEFKSELLACHTCNVRSCINPDHLYAGTGLDNHIDSVNAGTCKLSGLTIKTHCPKGHEYTIENTHIDPRTRNKRCKICYATYQTHYRAINNDSLAAIIARMLKK
jgi:hypothetical protein